ncbi:MAG: phage portal protein [Pseudomonadota bacterium]
MALQGYARNPIVYRCVRLISEAAASVPWLCYQGTREVEDHPALAMIKRPNTSQTQAEFLERLIGFMLLAGNGYVERVTGPDGRHRLYILRSDTVEVRCGEDGWPTELAVRQGSRKRFIALGDCIDGRSALHLKLFDPLDDTYGLPPLRAALASLDVHNAATVWNKALLDNAARPSGALVYAPSDNANLTPEQFETLRRELDDSFSGARNAGRPLLLEGGLDWKAMSMTPSDLDFVETKNGAAREISLAFGVPPMLLGIPGDNTYSNYQEAQRAFYRLTVLPLLRRLADAFSNWLAPTNGGDLRLDVDTDQIEGLAAERDSLWERVGRSDFLTNGEKRQAVGYSPQPEGTDVSINA